MRWFPRGRHRVLQLSPNAGEFEVRWSSMLARELPIWNRVPPDDRSQVLMLAQRFITEKEFWGSKGLIITDEIKVFIAAQACILILRLDRLGLYPQTREVIVYPGEFGTTVEAVAPDGRRMQIAETKVGETWRRGPVLLSWDEVLQDSEQAGHAHNTIFHEFAHALDFLDGDANGMPPLKTSEQAAQWTPVWRAAFDAFVSACQRGRRTFLDPYAATNPAEFFAVATEAFFEVPARFRTHHPALYEQLKIFFGQDPARWA